MSAYPPRKKEYQGGFQPCWAQFLMQDRFEPIKKLITYVFSTTLNTSTPPASNLLLFCEFPTYTRIDTFSDA